MTIPTLPATAAALRLALAQGPSPQAIPENWTFRVNWKAFITSEDIGQARRIERSGSLDDWCDPQEDVYGK